MKLETTKKEEQFFNAYLEAIDFTETGDTGQPPEGAKLDESFLRESLIDCLAFFSRVKCYILDDWIEQAGHDFWLTRNGHGAGFWDRGDFYRARDGFDRAEVLDKTARSFGEAYAIFEEYR